MTRAQYKKRRTIQFLTIGAVCLLVISVMVWAGFVRAATNVTSVTSYTVTFTSGNYQVPTVNADYTYSYTNTATGLFSNVTKTITEDNAECITLPGPDFAATITSLNSGFTTYYTGTGSTGTRLDEETFKFGSDWYSFTGWKIAGTANNLPGKTVFQPGDTIPAEILADYAPSGSLTLQALWGRCYFIQNAHTTMYYESYNTFSRTAGDMQEDGTTPRITGKMMYYCSVCSSGPTGASDWNSDGTTLNSGRDPITPIRTVERLYSQLYTDRQDQWDPYMTVAMLTGDLDLLQQRAAVDADTGTSGIQYPCIGQTNVPIQDHEAIYYHSFYYKEVTHKLYFLGSDGRGERFASTYNAESVTFKSLQATRTYDETSSKVTYTAKADTKYTFKFKCFADEAEIRGSLRLDNVALTTFGTLSGSSVTYNGETVGNILQLLDGDIYKANSPNNGTGSTGAEITVFECTARVGSPTSYRLFPFSNLRASYTEAVCLNGGYFNCLTYSWGDRSDGGSETTPADFERERYWYIGRNAKIQGSVYIGSTSTDGNTTIGYLGDVDLFITGGTITDAVYGTSVTSSNDAPCTGDRNIYVYNAVSIANIYAGGYGADLVGNVNLKIRNATGVTNVYGGGLNFTASVYGNVNMDIVDSTINGDIYGGGAYGSVEENAEGEGGNITLNIVNSTVGGTVYGIGNGSTGSVTEKTNNGAKYDDTEFLANWKIAPTGFPTMDLDTTSSQYGYATTQIRRTITFNSGASGTAGGLNYTELTYKYYLAPASAKSVAITVDSSNVTGDIYGGGQMSYVKGDTSITVKGSSVVSGTVLGGSKGGSISDFDKVTVATPVTGTYTPAAATVSGTSATITQTWDTAPTTESYTWTADESLLNNAIPGFDTVNKRIYSPNVSLLGTVGGDTFVTITDSAHVGAVYGGGNAGDVDGSTNISISGTCTVGTAFGDAVFGGGNSGTVASTNVNISGSPIIYGNVYGGGNSGAVTGTVNVSVSGGTLTGYTPSNTNTWSSTVESDGKTHSATALCGGGRNGNVGGKITMTLTGGIFGWVNGGGYNGNVQDVDVTVGKAGYTGDDAPAVANTSTLPSSYGADVPVISWCFRGGGESGTAGNVNVTINGGLFYRNNFMAGTGSAASCTSVTTVVNGGRFQGGFFNGGDWGPVTGNTDLTVNGGLFCSIYGGGDRPASYVGGNTKITLNGGAIFTDDCYVFGGARRGVVNGNTEVIVNSATADGYADWIVFAGGNGSISTSDGYTTPEHYGDIGGTTTVTVTANGVAEEIWGGNYSAGHVGENATSSNVINVTVNGTVTQWVVGGSFLGGTIHGSTNVTIGAGAVITGTGDTGGGAVLGGSYGFDSAGATITGNTNVTVSGGTVSCDIFGGNNKVSTVSGSSNVTVSGGTVTNVYGGNKNNGTVNSANVTINSDVSGAVYGGNNAGGTVTNAATVTLTSGAVPNIYGGSNTSGTVGSVSLLLNGGNIGAAAYGGNYGGGTITGNVTVTQNGTKFDQAQSGDMEDDPGVLFGGNCNAGTIKGNIEIVTNAGVSGSGGNSKNIFGGNYGGGTIEGNVNIQHNSGYVYVILGGNDSSGTILGDVTITVADPASINRVFGGGRNGGVIGSAESPSKVTVNYNTTDYGWEIYGGSFNSGELYGEIEVNMTAGRIQNTIAGGGKEASISSNTTAITVNITGGEVHRPNSADDTYHTANGHVQGGSISGDCAVKPVVNIGTPGQTGKVGFIRFVYGGCRSGNASAGATVNIYDGYFQEVYGGSKEDTGSAGGEVEVNFYGGVVGRLVGGGYKAKTTGNTTVNLLGGTVDINAVTPTNMGNAKNQTKVDTLDTILCGGGYNAAVTGNAYVNISGGTVGSASNAANVYCGGFGSSATVSGNTYMNITGGIVSWDVFGGGCSGAVLGDTNITISGTNFPVGSNFANAIYGGGNLASVKNANVTISGAIQVKAVYGGGYKGAVTGNTDVKISNGTYTGSVYGGGSMGAVGGNASLALSGGSVGANVYGGGQGVEATVGKNTYVEITGGTFAWDVFGGGNAGEVMGDTYVTVSNNVVLSNSLYGGGLSAAVKNTHITVTNTQVKCVYGGGYQGVVTGSTDVNISSSTISASVYGGGNEASVGNVVMNVDSTTVGNNICGGGYGETASASSVVLAVTGGTAKNIYGGGYSGAVNGSVAVLMNGATVTDEFCGGGYGAAVGSVDLTITGGTKLLGQNDARAYGGGRNGIVNGDINILIGGNSQITPNFYGGGMEGAVKGTVTLNITGATFASDVYGGGRNGIVGNTVVAVTDSGTAIAMLSDDTNLVVIEGNLFGGGEGETATVQETAQVIVDMKFEFTVTEGAFTTTEISDSGATKSEYAAAAGDWSVIKGNVYGGGDMGRVGNGTIYNSGAANVSQPGSTSVEIRNGQILGHVFGGGCGIPAENLNYNTYMGAVFGSTDVLINGGYIGQNIYGGGQQSRVYSADADDSEVLASNVTIREIEGKKIAIDGSVFGGGDRGDSESANASVPTTVGNVLVTIQGIKDKQPSDIFFLNGGVYGDGNLCLVDGYRQIILKDFEPSEDKTRVKTFYSLQRADKVTLDNSAVVLLGAVDLVEEGDTALYSINRVGHLEMMNGSVVKLDQVVKYLGELTSDAHYDRYFIHLGNNGSNGYTTHGCDGSCLNALGDDLVDAYRSGNPITVDGETHTHTDDSKNVVCVANGLYLEIMGEDNEYGAVDGLFTLQLLNANPGEGGGFVYGSIEESNGDFICETKEWVFAKATSIDSEAAYNAFVADGTKLYIRVAGQAYQTATGYVENQTYYYRDVANEDPDAYMEIIDNVGGWNSGEYSYYYWYIGGSSVTYDVNVIGYIGTENTQFSVGSNIPQHSSTYDYVLYGVSVNDVLATAVGTDGSFQLVQSSVVTGNQIAIELKNGDTSLGFLVNDGSNGWGMQIGSDIIYGYDGDPEEAKNNVLASLLVNENNDQMSWVLHKSTSVSKTISDMEVYLDIDLYTDADKGELGKLDAGTTVLSFSANFSLIRLVPNQNLYYDSIRGLDGVGSTSGIYITGDSLFTAEYQTKYVPAAFPGVANTDMKWVLSTETRYYYTSGASFITVDASGKVVGKSDDVAVSSVSGAGNNTITVGDLTYTRSNAFESDNQIPAGTKITLVDLSGAVPTYYYYICDVAMTSIDLNDFMQMGTKTAISAMDTKPAFMSVYDSQIMEQFTERVLFIFDFEQVDFASTDQFDGGVVFQHLFEGVDIMDHMKEGNIRANPKDVAYHINPGESGVYAESYTATITEDSVTDIGTATLIVNADEHPNWVNTLFRENGYAFKVTLQDANGNAKAMPAGMYFEYKGQYYYPGRDSTFVSVPVYEFGSHEIIIHNPQFSLADAVVGDTAYFKVEFYSAPDADYYNSYNTGEAVNDSYTITANESNSLKVESLTDNRVVAPGGEIKFKLYADYTPANGENDPYPWVEVELYQKDANGVYQKLDVNDVFDLGGGTTLPANGDGSEHTFMVNGQTAAGTYRLMFRYGGHTEYLNFIVTG